MVLLWHHSEEPFTVPEGTSMFLCVAASLALAGDALQFNSSLFCVFVS